MKIKQTKAARIAELEQKLKEAEAQQAHVYHFADAGIGKMSTEHLMGSGVMLTLTVLGGCEVFRPVLIRDGLSDETIAALKEDLKRSFKLATLHKPNGVE